MRFEIIAGDPRTIHRDKRVPLKVRGLFDLILCMPKHWNFTIHGLASMTPDGKVAVKACLLVLIQLGYAKRIKYKNSKTGAYTGKGIKFYENGNGNTKGANQLVNVQKLPGMDPRPTARQRKMASPNGPVSPVYIYEVYKICYLATTPSEHQTLNSQQRGRVMSVLGQLRDAGADLNDIAWFEKWWKNDWRSRDRETKQYQPPRPDQILEHWWIAIKSIKPLVPVPVEPNGTPQIVSNILDFQKMHEVMSQKALNRKQ